MKDELEPARFSDGFWNTMIVVAAIGIAVLIGIAMIVG